MACEMVASHSFAIPITDHRIHASTEHMASWSVGAGADPFLMPILFGVELSDMFAVLSV